MSSIFKETLSPESALSTKNYSYFIDTDSCVGRLFFSTFIVQFCPQISYPPP